MIDIYILEQLVAFSKYGTLSAAAEHLNISQPAVTNSMKKLEELMEVTLFERQKNKITLNDNGKLTAELAEKILEQESEMITRVRNFDKSKHRISLGSCAPIPVDYIVPLLSRLYQNMTISSELKENQDILIKGLQEDVYQLIVLHIENFFILLLYSMPNSFCTNIFLGFLIISSGVSICIISPLSITITLLPSFNASLIS